MHFHLTIFAILAMSFSALAVPTPLVNKQGLMDFLNSFLAGGSSGNGQEGSGSGNLNFGLVGGEDQDESAATAIPAANLLDLLEKIFPSGFPAASVPGQDGYGQGRSGNSPARPTPSCSTSVPSNVNGPVRPTPTSTVTPTRRPSTVQPSPRLTTTSAPPSQTAKPTVLPGDSVSTISFELAGPGGR